MVEKETYLVIPLGVFEGLLINPVLNNNLIMKEGIMQHRILKQLHSNLPKAYLRPKLRIQVSKLSTWELLEKVEQDLESQDLKFFAQISKSNDESSPTYE